MENVVNEDDKARELIDRFTGDLINIYTKEMRQAKNTSEMFALITAVMVFKNLVLEKFKEELELDMSQETEDKPEDICILMDEVSVNLAQQIRVRANKSFAN